MQAKRLKRGNVLELVGDLVSLLVLYVISGQILELIIELIRGQEGRRAARFWKRRILLKFSGELCCNGPPEWQGFFECFQLIIFVDLTVELLEWVSRYLVGASDKFEPQFLDEKCSYGPKLSDFVLKEKLLPVGNNLLDRTMMRDIFGADLYLLILILVAFEGKEKDEGVGIEDFCLHQDDRLLRCVLPSKLLVLLPKPGAHVLLNGSGGTVHGLQLNNFRFGNQALLDVKEGEFSILQLRVLQVKNLVKVALGNFAKLLMNHRVVLESVSCEPSLM